ncbi:MAG TPA: (d)CMP kinase [Armatimonadota bacterium]
MIVAIDGPAGAGKSTVARGVAEALGYAYIDSGAMYRAVAWLARDAGVLMDSADGLAEVARQHPMRFVRRDGRQVLMANGRELDGEIRTPEISHLSSVVSVVPAVREALVAQQRRMGSEGDVVMEGRDIGTVVFPGAEVKVFLTASEEERARRRAEELQSRGEPVSLDQVRREVRERDARDQERAHSPLVPAKDAVEVSTDGLSVEQVIERILEICREKRWA